MSYSDRKEFYSRIEELRRRPLIAYVTSIRPGNSAEMCADAIPVIIEQVEALHEKSDSIDLLIVSNGGDPIVSLRIISILRERFKHIGVLVPYVAYSAATILALGADEIVMHPYSNLGPVDPQLTVSRQSPLGPSANIQFGSEDIRNYIDFIKSDVGITNQEQLVTAFNALAAEVGSLSIGSSKRSQQLSLSLSEKMLKTHMSDEKKAAEMAMTLNTSYYHHGYAVNRTEAKTIGLNVIVPDKDLEKLLWSVWKDFDAEMKCSKPLDIAAEIFSHPEVRDQMLKVPVISIPAGLPPEITQALLQNLTIPMQTTVPIEDYTMLASIESMELVRSIGVQRSTICWRDGNMDFKFNTTSTSEGWK